MMSKYPISRHLLAPTQDSFRYNTTETAPRNKVLLRYSTVAYIGTQHGRGQQLTAEGIAIFTLP
jgi:hypothetical protein